MKTQRQLAADPQTTPTNLGCESTCMAATVHVHHRHLLLVIILQTDTYCPDNDGLYLGPTWLDSLVIRALDSQFDNRGFDARPPRQILEWVTVFG